MNKYYYATGRLSIAYRLDDKIGFQIKKREDD